MDLQHHTVRAEPLELGKHLLALSLLVQMRVREQQLHQLLFQEQVVGIGRQAFVHDGDGVIDAAGLDVEPSQDPAAGTVPAERRQVQVVFLGQFVLIHARPVVPAQKVCGKALLVRYFGIQ